MGLEFCFLGLMESTWLDIFSLAKIFLPGLVMVCFGANYQLRKKSEIAVKVGIARLRIIGYTDIAETYSRLYEQISPTLEENSQINKMLDCFNFYAPNTDYSKEIGAEISFNKFYDEICMKQREYEIYLDYKVQRQCRDAISVFTEIKQIMDAFCDTEHLLCKNMDADKLQHRINFSYLLMAVLLKNQINKMVLCMGDVIAEQVNNARVTYKKYRFHRMQDIIIEPILRLAKHYMDDRSWKGWLSQKFLLIVQQERIALIEHLAILVEILSYIHCSDKYSASEYFMLTDDERAKVSAEYMQMFYIQMHHNS